MQRAVNPQTGEVLFLVNNQWTPPSQVATNPETGQMAYLVNNQWQVDPQKKEEESSTLRQAADIPVQVGRGAVMGVRMLSDTLGANNPVSQALSGVEDYLGELLSAEAQKDQQQIAKILKDAEDKGVLDQVKAGIQALAVAPVDLVSQVVGTAVPTIASGLLGRILKLGAVGIGTLQAGTGAAMGAGLAKGNIYEVVKQELMEAEIPEEIAEERAKAAQNYTGENWDQIILGGVLGGAAALGPLERIFARLPAIPHRLRPRISSPDQQQLVWQKQPLRQPRPSKSKLLRTLRFNERDSMSQRSEVLWPTLRLRVLQALVLVLRSGRLRASLAPLSHPANKNQQNQLLHPHPLQSSPRVS